MGASFEPITLYTNKACPYAQRAVIALAETKIPHDAVEIDLQDKPTWYAPNINPASKVPAIAYGASFTDKSSPPPNAVKLAESLVLVEFFAELAPNSGLLPKDPVGRARARFFITLVCDKFSPVWNKFASSGEGEEALLKAIDLIVTELDPAGPYALGSQWTVADTALAPFVGRMYMCLENDVGAWKEGAGPKFLEQLKGLDKWSKYATALLERKSVQDSFPTDYLLPRMKERYLPLRK